MSLFLAGHFQSCSKWSLNVTFLFQFYSYYTGQRGRGRNTKMKSCQELERVKDCSETNILLDLKISWVVNRICYKCVIIMDCGFGLSYK